MVGPIEINFRRVLQSSTPACLSLITCNSELVEGPYLINLRGNNLFYFMQYLRKLLNSYMSSASVLLHAMPYRSYTSACYTSGDTTGAREQPIFMISTSYF